MYNVLAPTPLRTGNIKPSSENGNSASRNKRDKATALATTASHSYILNGTPKPIRSSLSHICIFSCYRKMLCI